MYRAFIYALKQATGGVITDEENVKSSKICSGSYRWNSINRGIMAIKPWKDVDAVSTYQQSSANTADYNVTINAYTIWANKEKLEEQIIQKFDENSFESVMFSTDMWGDKVQSVTFKVYANAICQKLGIVAFSFDY